MTVKCIHKKKKKKTQIHVDTMEDKTTATLKR